jgi:Telomeric single stranded DNA binding POT1/CDC13
LTSADPQHVYGVVIDATFPYKTNQDRYICSLKIVDPSLYVKTQKGTGDASDFATLVLYAKRFEDLPIISKLGDIIRVHRATLRLYNGQRQFNANIFYNSSWTMFSADGNDSVALSHSGKHYSFEKSESAVLANTRKWASAHFNQYNGISNDMFVALNKAAAQKTDFDVVAKVSQVFELDEYTNELRLRDASSGNKSWNVLALKLKFPNVHSGDVVRIRSVTYDETSTQKQVLLLSHYSNIMAFPANCKLAKEVRAKVADEKVDKASLTGVNATFLTEVDKKHAGLPVHSLQDLFHNVETDKDLQSKDTFRTQFYVTKIESADVKEWTKSFDKKTKKASSFKGTKGGANAIYQVQLLVKDVSTQFNNNTYRVLLYTHDGLGANFFNTPADNLYTNAGAAKKLQEYSGLLTKFNSWVDAVVERKNGFYFIKDTKITF